MTLEQLILSIRPSWDAACCLLIAPPFHKTAHPPTPQWPAAPPRLSLCQYVLKDTHCTARVTQTSAINAFEKTKDAKQQNKQENVRRAASDRPSECSLWRRTRVREKEVSAALYMRQFSD